MKTEIKSVLEKYGINPNDEEIGLVEFLFGINKRILERDLEDKMIQELSTEKEGPQGFGITRQGAKELIIKFNEKGIIKIEIIRGERYVKLMSEFYAKLLIEAGAENSKTFIANFKATAIDVKERSEKYWKKISTDEDGVIKKVSENAKSFLGDVKNKVKDFKNKKKK